MMFGMKPEWKATPGNVVYIDSIGFPLVKSCRHCNSTMFRRTEYVPDEVPGGYPTGKTKGLPYMLCPVCGEFEAYPRDREQVRVLLGRTTAGDGLDFSGPEITD